MPSFLGHLNFTHIAIISALFASVAVLLARVLLKELRSRDMLVVNFMTMAAVLLLLSPWFYRFDYSLLAVGLVIGIALMDALANYFYFKTFEKTEASAAAPALSLAPAFTFILGWLVLGERVSLSSAIFAVLIIAGVVVFTLDFKNWRALGRDTLLPAVISSFLFGVSAIPTKYLLSAVNATNAPTLYMLRAGLIALVASLFFRFSIKEISLRQFRWIFLRGLFVIGQWLLLYYALTAGSAGVTLTLANITPIFVFLLGLIFLREKFTVKKILAALLILFLSLTI